MKDLRVTHVLDALNETLGRTSSRARGRADPHLPIVRHRQNSR